MKVKVMAMIGVLSCAGLVQAMPQYGSYGAAPGMDRWNMPRQMPRSQQPRPMAGPQIAFKAGMDKLLAFVSQETRPSGRDLALFLEYEIAPYFDFYYMAESAGGRVYAKLDASGKAAMVDDIKRSFLGKMAEKLAGFENQQVSYLRPRMGRDGRTAQLSVAIGNAGRYPARMDFRLYKGDGGWKVYDVAANGQSAVVHYRRQLRQQMTQQMLRQRGQPRPMMQHPRQGMPMMPR